MSKLRKTPRYKVYIAGKVTGLPYEEAFQKFLDIEQMLTELGQEVVNPMKLVPEGTGWNSAMRLCIPALFRCNAIYLIPGWKDSLGATLEYTNANAMGFKLFNEAVISELRSCINAKRLLKQLQN